MNKLLKNLSIFFATGIIVLLIFNFILMPLYVHARNIVVIPDLEGLTLSEANQLSKSEGIEVVVTDTIFTNDLNPNIILEQFPSSGKEVKLGRTIKLKITQFNQKIAVPSLIGKTLRAAEIDANLMLKSTRVDGVFNEDPEKNNNAKKYDEITYKEVVSSKLKVMDLTAITLCEENEMPIRVFDGTTPGNIYKALTGESMGTLIK